MIAFFPSRTIALTLGPVAIHWYGIMYLIAFLIGMLLIPRLQRYRDLRMSASEIDSLFLFVFLGVLLGGRLGFVLFYGGTYYIDHPFEIIAVWHGGMSSHGGFIGVLLGLVLFCRKNSKDFFSVSDMLMPAIAIGLALGRIGNFINGELYGTVTNVPWAMSFPGAEGLRHPTQLYAVLKDVFLASFSFIHLRISSANQMKSGRTTALFLMLYASLRFVIEQFRDQPYGYSEILGLTLSRGQLLTVPLFVLGVILLRLRSKRL